MSSTGQNNPPTLSWTTEPVLFDNLPDEIIGTIFIVYVNSDGNPYNLRLVCRHWNTLSMGMLRLWTRIRVDNYNLEKGLQRWEGREICNTASRLKKHLTRLEQAPLDLELVLTSTPNALNLITNILAPKVVPRWKTAHIIDSLPAIPRIIASAIRVPGMETEIEGDFTALTQLKLTCYHGLTQGFFENHVIVTRIISRAAQTANKLQTLELEDVPLHYSFFSYRNSLWKGLHHFTLQYDVPIATPELSRALLQTTFLQRLKIVNTDIDVPKVALSLPHLKVLHLSGSGFELLRNLTFPSLTFLTIENMPESSPSLPHSLYFPALLHLRLVSDHLPFFKAIDAPKIESLSIHYPKLAYSRPSPASQATQFTTNPSRSVLVNPRKFSLIGAESSRDLILGAIKRMDNIEDLHVSRCPEVKGSTFRELGSRSETRLLPKLRRLQFQLDMWDNTYHLYSTRQLQALVKSRIADRSVARLESVKVYCKSHKEDVLELVGHRNIVIVDRWWLWEADDLH